MDANRWHRLETVFFAALELESSARRAFLDEACGDDAAFRLELESMLSAEEDGMALALESRLLAEHQVGLPDPVNLVGSQIGPYRLEKLIGEGGMGEVYLAWRDDEQYEQKVALKLVKPGHRSAQMLTRFRMERQVLARLTHPNITQLLDGGIDREGRPYLVMQYVEGIPITDFCDKNALSIDDRLDLFRTVCRAVQHAHRNLVVHRDLKPSNILVTDEGVVKLLDFGIAKLLDPAWDLSVAVTQSQVRLMTPEYAAPEQVKGDAITTATDVYALGVLLYEILSGRRPYRLGNRMQVEIERVICEEVPARPSTAVTEIAPEDAAQPTNNPASVSRARRTGVSRLKKMLQGDLDNIVMMALRKEPERRYASAEQLSQDIARYLDGHPVAAQKDTAGYRLKKFVRRNRVSVLAGVTIFLLLLGFTISMVIQSRALAIQRDRAQIEAEKATQVAQFLVDLFDNADPNENQGEPVSIEEILKKGTENIENDLADQPEVQSTILEHLGRVHNRLGLLDISTELYLRSLELNRNLYGDQSIEVAYAQTSLAENYIERGQLDEADSLLSLSLAIQRAGLDARHKDIAATLNGMGGIAYRRGEFEAAENYFDEAITIWAANKGDTDKQVVIGYSSLSAVQIAAKKQTEAEKNLLRALELADSLDLKKHIVLASVLNNLAHLYALQDRVEEADSLFVQSLAMRRELFGNDHQIIPVSLNNLAMLRQKMGKLDEAEDLALEGLTLQRRLGGPMVGRAAMNVAAIQFNLGKYTEAEAHNLEALSILIDGFGADNGLVKKVRQQLVNLYEAWDKPGLAEEHRAMIEANE